MPSSVLRSVFTISRNWRVVVNAQAGSFSRSHLFSTICFSMFHQQCSFNVLNVPPVARLNSAFYQMKTSLQCLTNHWARAHSLELKKVVASCRSAHLSNAHDCTQRCSDCNICHNGKCTYTSQLQLVLQPMCYGCLCVHKTSHWLRIWDLLWVDANF